MIAAPVLARASDIRAEFTGARPFRHACIEDFLEPAWAETLLQEFPAFDPAKAVDEFGKVGRKAVRTDLREISDRYREFYDYISSPAFLEAMSAMTGIPDLRFDNQMYGGGTHENLEGQALDAHVDFNYDQARQLHRRINLLVYLNKEWREDWGGAIQLHSDPRDWEHDQVKTFNSTFNRCVIFETNEHSWHGFRRIQLPEDKHGLTRKCISIYLYTETRPQQEIVPMHGTFYVQRPLPARFAPGLTLGADELREIAQAHARRDEWLQFYRRLEQELLASVRGLGDYAATIGAHNRAEALLSRLPLSRRLRTPLRKSSALYLAARKRLAATGKPLALIATPEPRFAAGHVLDAADVAALHRSLRGRDGLIHRYQQRELELRGLEEILHRRVAAGLADLRLPLTGGLRQLPQSTQGAYAGDWVASEFKVSLLARNARRGLQLHGWFPGHYPADARVEARVEGKTLAEVQPKPGQPFVLEVPHAAAAGQRFTLEVVTRSPSPLPVPEGDQRDLAFVLQEIRGVA